jgi:hypothetical protein
VLTAAAFCLFSSRDSIFWPSNNGGIAGIENVTIDAALFVPATFFHRTRFKAFGRYHSGFWFIIRPLVIQATASVIPFRSNKILYNKI